MLPEELKNKLATFERPCWRPHVGPAVPGARSKFGGIPLLKEGEKWPCCGHCHRPMQLFVQLDSQDLPAAAQKAFGDGVLQVFYCTNADDECEIFEAAYLPFSQSTLCRVIPRAQANGFDAPPQYIADAFQEKALTGWRRVPDYPDAREMEGLPDTLSDDEQELLFDAAFPRLGDKLLGWPHWVHEVEYPTCPHCETPMEFVLQLDSDHTLPFLFGEGGCAQLTRCAHHPDTLTLTWASP